ncbi:MAG: glycosyltransferase family 4 protein [Bacilli bacterium]|nr:glycosyltransferase family 4 protein [Bacilli bacterium]
MKVLVVFNHPAPYKVKLFNELAKSVDLDVIFEIKKAKNRTASFYKYNKYHFNVIKLRLHPIGKENVFGGALARYIKHHYQEYDHIIMNGYSQFAEMKAIRMMNRHSIPFILMINGGIIHKENRIKKNIKTKYISSAKMYFSPNEESNRYLEYYGADKSKIKLFKYSNIMASEINHTPLPEDVKTQICLKYHLPYGKIYINPGQFIPRKNNEQLLHIFKDRQETLLLVGRGPLQKKYESYIKENNIHNIFIMDYLEEPQIKEVMKCATALITLSKEDIFGHTVLEALSSGLPVISSDKVVSSLEMIHNGVNGYIVSLDKEDEINDAINNVLNLDYNDIINSLNNHTIEQTSIDIIKGLE